MRTRVVHTILVLLACLAIYWPMLSFAGLGSSEGHRVGPAWGMLESGDWTHLRLFGSPTSANPQACPGPSPSAPPSSARPKSRQGPSPPSPRPSWRLVALWFTNRWLGSPWGLAAALTQALTPLFATIGRTAEIDPLNALAAQIAALALISLLSRPRVPSAECLLPNSRILLPTGIILAGIIKGPASLPVLLGIALAACIQARIPGAAPQPCDLDRPHRRPRSPSAPSPGGSPSRTTTPRRSLRIFPSSHGPSRV